MNEQRSVKEELHPPSAGWRLLNVSVGGWAVVLWSPLPCPCNLPPRSDTPLCFTPGHDLPASLLPPFPPLLSLVWYSPPPRSVWEELFKWKKRRKKYMYYYINLKKKKKEKEKKDYRELEIKVEVLLWNAEVMHYMEFRRWRCTGNLLILYILNLKIWKSDRQIKDKINLLWCGRSDVVLWRRRSNSQPLGFHCLTCSCGFRKRVTDILLWLTTTQL